MVLVTHGKKRGKYNKQQLAWEPFKMDATCILTIDPKNSDRILE